MSFLYPLFLAAGASLAIPVLIHLFNLRRYKTVLFPHTRFLKNIQLNSRRQSQVRYKWLLLARLLFLALVVLAFAQPVFNNAADTTRRDNVQFIYIDNSYSMSAPKGARRLIDVARDAALKQVRNAPPTTRFVLLTNDKPASYHAEQADKVVSAIQATEISPAPASVNKVLAAVQGILQQEGGKGADLYYYSDFQGAGFTARPPAALMEKVTFFGVPVQQDEVANIYIDTAWLSTPVLLADKSNFLVVQTRCTGPVPKEAPVLNLAVNGQVKSAASLDFEGKQSRNDTLGFQASGTGWQQLQLSISNGGLRFDDTFRVAGRCAPNLSVLEINEGPVNPYIQAAFRAYNGFRLNQADVSAIPPDWKPYNLVIFNGITSISESLGKMMADALQAGQTICIFPGQNANTDQLNTGLALVGDVHINGIDTAVQQASQLQQGSALVKDIFDRIPDNVQLPTVNWHYIVSAGLTANQQSVLSFRNGDPLLARYTPSRGQLFLCTTSADLQSGNFPGSYFFTPFLYQMATQGGGSNVYAVTAGSTAPLYLPLTNVSERNTLHATGNGTDVIPPQHPSGAGLDVYAGQVLQLPGYYTLVAPGADSTTIALNQDKAESQPAPEDLSSLKAGWKGANIKWMQLTASGDVSAGSGLRFPLWKVCVILALVMLAVETMLLARRQASA